MQGSIRKKGNSYYYRIHAGDFECEKYAGKTKAEADQALRQALTEYENTGFVQKSSSITLYKYLSNWLETFSCRAGTHTDYSNVINNHIQKHKIGKLPIQKVTIELLQQYIDEKSAVYSDSTIKSHFAVLNQGLNDAVYPKQLIKANPMLYVRRKKKEKNPLVDMFDLEEQVSIDTITTGQYQEILTKVDIYTRLVFEIGFHTGARLGEICALTWNDIDFTEKKMFIKKSLYYKDKKWRVGPTKTGKPRTIDIGDTLISILKNARKTHLSDQVFLGKDYIKMYVNVTPESNLEISTTEGTEVSFICVQKSGQLITNQYVKTNIRRYVRRGGEGIDFHMHMLRHTHATMLLQAGVAMKEVQERLGHSKLATTMEVYAHTTKESRKQTVDIFEEILFGGKTVGK